MIATTGTGFKDIMQGIAAVLWPCAVLVGLVLLRSELKDLLRRLRRGKLLGQEIELDKSLHELELGAEELAAKPLPALEPNETSSAEPNSGADSSDVAAEILELAGRSPKAALMQLSATLEREARRILAATGHAEKLRQAASLRAMVEVLETATSLPRGTLDVVRNFADIRNQIIHGHTGVSDGEVLRAIDAGLLILRAITGVARERNVVHLPFVTLYSDPEANHKIEDAHGIMLETRSAGGAIASYRIYPTTRDHFVKGREVAWEWNKSIGWGPTWYRNPDTDEIEYGWDGALEFIGRHLDDL